MFRDDRRGDDRRDEKDHKDGDRKRKHEAPTFLIFFLHRSFGCHKVTRCFPCSC